jgi:hypothetical protein
VRFPCRARSDLLPSSAGGALSFAAKPWRRSSGASFPCCRAKRRRNLTKTLALRRHRRRPIETLGRNLRRPAIKSFRLRRRRLGRPPRIGVPTFKHRRQASGRAPVAAKARVLPPDLWRGSMRAPSRVCSARFRCLSFACACEPARARRPEGGSGRA